MNPKDNPHIYGTRAAEAVRLHNKWQEKRDAPYVPSPLPRASRPFFFTPPTISSSGTISPGEPTRRSGMSRKTAINIVGMIVGGIAVVFAASHGVTSTLGLACACGFSAGPVIALLTKLTRS